MALFKLSFNFTPWPAPARYRAGARAKTFRFFIVIKRQRRVVEMIKNKEHLTPLGFKSVLSYYSSINRGSSKTVSNFFPDILKSKRPVLNLPLVLNPNWVSGFSAGESGFSIGVRPTTGQIYFRFHIAQHSLPKGST